MKGINTIIHDTILIPFTQRSCRRSVNNIVIDDLTEASLYSPREASTTIWMKLKIKYINAGPHKLDITILINQ